MHREQIKKANTNIAPAIVNLLLFAFESGIL